MSSLNKHVIKQPKPFHWFGFIVAVISITFAIQWYANQNSTQAQLQRIDKLEQVEQELEQKLKFQITENQQLSDVNTQLNQQLIEQKQHLAIQQATDQQLQEQIVELQNKVINLNKDLVFYQTVTQGNSSSHLQVRDLILLTDDHEADSYRYRVVITQGKKITKALTGTVNISIATKRDDKTNNITINEHPLNLRHVQVVEGQLKITDNVEPEKLIITIKQKKKKNVSQEFDWHVADNQ